MKAFDLLYHFFLRFRYPVSLPEDVANALGINVSNFLTFDEFVSQLTSSSCKPTSISKFMDRSQVEEAFKGALLKEHFNEKTIFSYYFSEGWMEFVLLFDTQSRLRRIYIQHKHIEQEEGVEIPLSRETCCCSEPLEEAITSNKEIL